MTTTFKTVIYSSAQAGMPSSTLNAAGALTAVLDAVLVDGMNTRTITSVTRSGSIATVNFSSTNNFAIGETVEVAGIDQAEYNGRFRVTAKTTGSVSYTVTGTPTSPGTFSGSPTIKHPAAGWTKSSLGTNIVGYRSATAGGLGLWMQVEDNNPYADANVSVRTRLAEALTALDTATSLGNQYKVQKATGGWVVVADPKTCYVVMNGTHVFMFGEYASYNPTDNYSFFQTRGETGESASVNWAGGIAPSGRYFPQCIYMSASATTFVTPGISHLRASSQLAGSVDGHCLETWAQAINQASNASPRQQQITSPNPADNAIPLMPLFVVEHSGVTALRGMFRGLYWPLSVIASGSFAGNVARLDDVVIGGAVRSVAVVRFGVASGSQMAFDLGDW